MRPGRAWAAVAGVVLGAVIVAGCTSGSDGNGAASATTTVTATDSVTSTPPPTTTGTSASSSLTGVPPSGSSGTPSGPGLCTPTVMTFAVAPGDGAAGTIYTAIIATNASQQACVTTGWPGVAVLNSAGKQVVQAQRMGAEGSTLTVQPGQKIHAVLSSTDVSQGTASCDAQPAILFTMPDNTDSTQIKGVPVSACHVWIQAFRPGSSG